MDHTKRYAISRHHAWAGSVLLAILLAIRLFITSTTLIMPEILFAFIGGILVLYIFISLILTYKYRSGLFQQQSSQDSTTKEPHISKEQLKIQKKQAKAELKQQKKQ